MAFKKGDNVRTEDGQPGVILFVDKNGEEAQVALARISLKIRTDSLEAVKAADLLPAVAPRAAAKGRSTKARALPSRPKI